ncbi:serine hydroxymethyltransferase [bacterium]|nr:serine hydroxymethyltransferase [bacterium]
MSLKNNDNEMYNAIKKERTRQEDHIELIASENYVSLEVLEAQGSVLTNKYAEGYPSKRYYGGCEYVDIAEELAKKRACELFNAKYANVQPHSGTQANMTAYRALADNGDTILGMRLDQGGHLSHGSALSFSGQDYKFISYGLDNKTETIDYKEVERLAKEYKPKIIVAGASAYPRTIDFKKFREIADSVSAYLMVDMAHIAGLVAAGYHENPVEYADIVTTTTHKTLRGPRGGLILTNNEDIYKRVNKTLFPGVQGGPLMHVIAAKGVAFYEDLKPEFKDYSRRIIENAKAMASEFIKLGYHVISGGTDNHLMLIDVKSHTSLTGKEAEKLLDTVNITVNKNSIPNDPEKPFITSGLRIGTPAITTRGFSMDECIKTVHLIDKALMNSKDENKLIEVKEEVIDLLRKHPLPYDNE